MAALTATTWTVNIIERYQHAMKRYVRAALTMASGLTYPSSGGVPLPARGSFGLVRQVDSIVFYETPPGASTKGVMWKWKTTAAATTPNRDVGAIRGFWAENPTAAGGPSGFVELPTTWKPSDANDGAAAGTAVFYATIQGW